MDRLNVKALDRALDAADRDGGIRDSAEGAPPMPPTRNGKADILARFGIAPIATVPRERIDWAWKGRFAFGKHTDISGDPGDGKSLVVTSLAAQITRGLPLPYGSEKVREPRPVLYLSAEDDPADTIRPRLEAAGGDVSLLHIQKDSFNFIFPGDFGNLESVIEHLRPGMVVIDPIFSYIGDLNPNDYGSAVAVCDPLKRLAAAHHFILATIRHNNKMVGASARYRPGGSVGWQAKPRLALSLGRTDDREVRALASIKGNVSREPLAATFRIEEVGEGDDAVARVLWGAESTITADEMMGTEGAGPKAPGKAERIAAYMRDRLEQAGPDGIESESLIADVLKLGMTTGRQTVYRARDICGVVDFKLDPDNPRSPLRWRIKQL